jgi:MoaA/NifB/PqqE/SkfB family radical SAM enzyme
MLLTWPGVPALLYGEEWGLAAEVLCEEPENAWLDRMAMPWARGADCREAQAWLASLIKARRESAALAEGTVEILHAGDSLLVYRRVLGTEAVDVVLHVGQDGASLEIVDDSWGPLEPWVTVGQVRVEGDTVALGGLSAVVARRLPGGPLRNPSVIVEANRRQRDQAVRLAQVEVPLWPTRLDFSLTERCNMRCRHCITDAPRRTAKGEARSMTPWVLEKLQSAFAHVDYAGFVHGGESLTSPMLFPVLKALREARGSLGFRAHVLTNGLLLTEDVAHALVEAGVTTLSVSLDGAHAATNDAIRDGGRFQTVVERLKQVLAARRTWGKGLRVGVSMVVLQQNLGELRNMVDLVADLGADWIKFEEGVPVNAFALQSLVLADDKRLLVALEDAMAWAQRRGLVAIDHTKPLEIWRCRLANDPAKAAFLSADEFANGSEIHPCRTLWETACVEPNGDVRCGDFFGPILGNVTEVPLVDLWRRPEAQVLRQQQLEGRVCGPRGPVTCLP